jgi:hypothetical protein
MCITDRGSIASDLREQLRGLCEGGLTMCPALGWGLTGWPGGLGFLSGHDGFLCVWMERWHCFRKIIDQSCF